MAGELDRSLTIGIDLDTSGVDAAAARFSAAAGKMAASIPKITENFGKVDPGIAKVNAQLLQMGVRFQESGQISARSLAAVGVQLDELGRQFGRAASGADRLSTAERQALTAAQGAYKASIQRLREYNSAMQEVTRSTRDWTSLEGALTGLGGTIGKVTTAVVGVLAAWETGQAIGKRLNKALEENVEGFKEWRDGFQDALVDATSSWDRFVLHVKGNAPTPPSLGELLTPQGAKGEATQFSIFLEQAQAARGIKSLGQLNAELAVFNDKVRIAELAGKSLGSVFEENRGQVEGLVSGFKSFGQSVPVLEGVVAGWKAVAEGQKAQQESLQKSIQLQNVYNTAAAQLLGIKSPEEATRLGALSDTIGKLGDDFRRFAELDAKRVEKAFDDIGAAVRTLEGNYLSAGRVINLTKLKPSFAPEIPGQTTLDLEQERKWEEERKRFRMAGARDLLAEEIKADQERQSAWKKTIEDSTKAFDAAVDKFGQSMADVFTAGVIGGAEGFGDAASRMFLDSVNAGAKDIFTKLGRLAFGAAPLREQYESQEEFAVAVAESNKQNEALMASVAGAVGAIGQTLDIFKNAKQGQEPSVLGTTLAFAATGASIGSLFSVVGTAIGAAVGAIAGAIVGLLASSKAKKEQPYAAYGIREGVPFVEAYAGQERQFENVTASMFNDMISEMQTTLERTQNDYIKLLLKFPDAVADSITAANFAPTMDKYSRAAQGWFTSFIRIALGPGVENAIWEGIRGPQSITEGQIGDPNRDKNARKTFLDDFNNWVSNTLPKEIIASFEEPLSRGFQTLEISAKKFEQIWDRIQAIDPKDAIATLNNLFDALTAFQNAEKFLSQTRLYGGAGFEFNTPGLLGQARIDNAKAFADALAQADFGLVQMGATIEELIGPEQITQAKEWGDALMQREQAVKQFFQQVAAAIDSVIRGYQASIRDLTLQGMVTAEGTPDVDAQVDYLKSYADQLYQQIQNAPTFEAATALSSELQRVILQIQQLGGSQSAEAAEAFRLWAIDQLRAAQDLVVTRLQDLAQAVADQNAAFFDAIKDFIEAFRHATDEINGTIPDATAPEDVPESERPRGEGRFGAGSPRRPNYEGANVIDFTQGSTLAPIYQRAETTDSAMVAEQRETNRRLGSMDARLERVEGILGAGRDISATMTTRVIVEGDGPPQEIVQTDDGEAFYRREIASRAR